MRKSHVTILIVFAAIAIYATVGTAFSSKDHQRAPSSSADNTPLPASKLPNVRWKKVWADEFNGKQPDEDADCYSRKALCLAASDQNPIECPDTAKDSLAELNKCNWTVLSHYDASEPSLHTGTPLNAFDPSEVSVTGGELVLSARAPSGDHKDCGVDFKDPRFKDAPNKSVDCPILSGAIISRPVQADGTPVSPTPPGDGLVKTKPPSGIVGFKTIYGRVELRAKLPESVGSWPTAWLLPVDASTTNDYSAVWPKDGLLEAFETTPDAPNEPVATFNSTDKNGDNGSSVHVSQSFRWRAGKKYYAKEDRGEHAFTAKYHVYAIEWDPLEVRFFVDRFQVGSIRQGQLLSTSNGEQKHPANIPSSPFFMMISHAVGTFPGLVEKFRPVPSAYKADSLRIDWIRIYSKCEDGTEAGCVESTLGNEKCTNPCDGIGRYDGHGCRVVDVPEGQMGVVWKNRYYTHPRAFGWIFRKLECPKDSVAAFGKGCRVGEAPQGRTAFSRNDEYGSRIYLEPLCGQ